MKQINFQKYEVNQELRQITFSCASATPYQRYDQDKGLAYNEILIINEDAVDLHRLNNGAPLLFNHDTDKLLGIVQKAFILDEKIFVTVRFSRNDEFADRIYKDILDGVIKNVSIGYVVQGYQDKKQDGVFNRYVNRWMIYQCSVVSIPADASVGIRQFQIQDDKKMEDIEKQVAEQTTEQVTAEQVAEQVAEQTADQTEAVETEAAEKTEDAEKIEELEKEIEILKAENQKMQRLLKEQQIEQIDDTEKVEIEKMAEDFGISKEQVRKAIEQKITVKEFKQNIKNRSFNIKNKDEKQMNKREFSEFLQARNFDRPFELRDFTGFASPALVGTETIGLAQALEKRLGVKGYRTLQGLRNNITIPVQTGRIAVTTPGINEPATDSNPVFESVTLAPVKFTASTVIGKQMLANSNSDVEAFIVDSLMKEIAYKVENYMLAKVAEGAGKEINYASADAITYKDILAMEAAVDGFVTGELRYVMSPAARASLRALPKAEGTIAGFVCEGNQINGYEVGVSGCVANENIYLGDWNQLVLATWAEGMEILIDPYTEGRAGNVVVVGSMLADAGVIQKDAFAIGKVQA